ncbi:MAG: SPOR domain-containing protein [Rhodospirillales bacterium]|nr:SPOR domain-containing protein [Rhodospirillales bacterium]
MAVAVVGVALQLAGCAGTSISMGSPEATATSDRYERIMRVADKARANGDLVSAASLYEQALTIKPEQLEPLIALGDVSTRLGDANRGASYFSEALAIAPRNADARRGYGAALLTLNYPEEAAQQFEIAAELDPSDVRSHNGLGVANDLLGQHQNAQQSYLRGLQKDADNDSLRNNLALSMALTGHYEDAIAMLRGINTTPDLAPRVRQNLALVYALAGRIDDAAQIARQDLSEDETQDNLSFYQSLQGLSGRALAQAVFYASMGGAAARSAEPDLAAAPTPVRRNNVATLNGGGKPSPVAASMAEPKFVEAPVVEVKTIPADQMSEAVTVKTVKAETQETQETPETQSAKATPMETKGAATEAEPAPMEVALDTSAQDDIDSGDDDETTTPLVLASGTPTVATEKAADPSAAKTAKAAVPTPLPVSADVASEDAETPVTTAAESDPVGATETEIETATETEAAPETEAVAEPATEQVASDGQSEPMVGFDDVAWRLRAYLADDSSVPVPANEEASANEETSAAQKEAESVATSTANASNPVDPEERAEAAPPSEDTGDADVFADSAESETTAQEPAVTESAIPEPAVAEPTVAEVPEPELTETTKVAAVVPDPAPAPIPAPAPAPVAEEQPEVEPSEPVAAETKPEASKPFQVQLASVKTEEGAMAEWKRMQKQVNKILPDAEPHFVRAEVRGKGVFYRIRVDASPSFSEARALCGAIGDLNLSCLVVPPTS